MARREGWGDAGVSRALRSVNERDGPIAPSAEPATARERGTGKGGVSSGPGFRLHRDHAFGGMEIVGPPGNRSILARCDCGHLLDIAEAVFRLCPECKGVPTPGRRCRRCGGTGEVVDHAALWWRTPEEWRTQHGGAIP
jgi:hypothetical protein